MWDISVCYCYVTLPCVYMVKPNMVTRSYAGTCEYVRMSARVRICTRMCGMTEEHVEFAWSAVLLQTVILLLLIIHA